VVMLCCYYGAVQLLYKPLSVLIIKSRSDHIIVYTHIIFNVHTHNTHNIILYYKLDITNVRRFLLEKYNLVMIITMKKKTLRII